jgi:hypothetical protein
MEKEKPSTGTVVKNTSAAARWQRRDRVPRSWAGQWRKAAKWSSHNTLFYYGF